MFHSDNMSKCRGKYCKNCVEEYCEVVLDMFEDEVEMFEESDIVDGEVWVVDGYEPWRDIKGCWDYYESEWRK